MSTAVVLAERQLSAARADEARSKREAAKQEIKRLRREGAVMLKQLRPMVRQIRDAEQERLKLNSLLVQAKDRIEFYSVPLDPATFPTDDEISAHAAQLAAWKTKQQDLLTQNTDAVRRESIRMEAVALQARLQQMQYSIQNLTAVAEGRRPGDLPEGGAFMGVEDFLGHTDRRFS